MALRIADHGARHAAAQLIGRREELERLGRLLDDGTYLTFVHGVAGVGKSSLLAAFSSAARKAGAFTIVLDCRTLEPTDRGVLDALAAALGTRTATIESISKRLARLSSRAVLAFDHYEVFRLLDTWLRQAFVPVLPDNVRIIVCGREAPVAAWLTAPELAGSVDRMRLEPLEPEDAVRLFVSLGIPEAQAERFNRVVHGHPLAIRLAASAAADRPDLGIDDIAAHAVINELTRLFLTDVPDPITREALRLPRSSDARRPHFLPRCCLTRHCRTRLIDCARCPSSRRARTGSVCMTRSRHRWRHSCDRPIRHVTAATGVLPGASCATRFAMHHPASCGGTRPTCSI